MATKPEIRVQELHLILPEAPKPVAKYKTALRDGNLLYVSGHGPLKEDKTMITGRVGKDLTLEQGKLAARQVGLAILATVRANSDRWIRWWPSSRRWEWSMQRKISRIIHRSSTASPN